MKKHSFRSMSDRVCNCGRKIKKSMIDKNPHAKYCYKCYRNIQANKGNIISTAREVKTGKCVGRKGGKYNPVTV